MPKVLTCNPRLSEILVWQAVAAPTKTCPCNGSTVVYKVAMVEVPGSVRCVRLHLLTAEVSARIIPASRSWKRWRFTTPAPSRASTSTRHSAKPRMRIRGIVGRHKKFDPPLNMNNFHYCLLSNYTVLHRANQPNSSSNCSGRSYSLLRLGSLISEYRLDLQRDRETA